MITRGPCEQSDKKKKEAQQTDLSEELIFESGQSLPGMFLHSEKRKAALG